MIRAVIFAAIVGGATWAADLYDRWIRKTDERNEQ